MSKHSRITAGPPIFAGNGPPRETEQALFALILEHVREGIAVQDLNGRIEWLNPACEQMFGWSLAEMRGRRPQDFIVPPELRSAPESETVFRYDLNSPIFKQYQVDEHMRRDGSRFWNQQSFAILRMGEDERETRVVISCRDVSAQVQSDRALRQVQVDLERAAHHDDLTGLANRKKLKKFMQSKKVKSHLAARDIGALQLDIDKFKEINDTLGHAAGDATLVHVANAMRAQCGPDDLICRAGGDEFLQICPGVNNPKTLMARAEQLRRVIETPMVWNGQSISVGTSIGISLPIRDGTHGELLIQMADQALYAAKARGRSQVVRYTDALGRAQVEEMRLARELQTAVVHPQFEVHLQPQLSFADNQIVGCEALLRWIHPNRGVLYPGVFLETAERNGLLAQVDYISMNLALDALMRLRQEGYDGLRMALNVSGSILADRSYVGKLKRALHKRELEPHDICVEILEASILDRNGQDVMRTVDALKRLGVWVVLDDFGTGYAGLANLSAFDIDAIKLDRVMINQLEGDTRSRAVVRSIIRLADLLGMQTIAGGVETQAQLDILRRTSCPIVQGFGIARPMPVADTISWLRENASPQAAAYTGSASAGSPPPSIA